MQQFGRGFTISEQQSTYQTLLRVSGEKKDTRQNSKRRKKKGNAPSVKRNKKLLREWAERRNGKGSRAHRLDKALRLQMQEIPVGVPHDPLPSAKELADAIKGIVDLYGRGFVTPDNLLKIVVDIAGGK